MSVESLSLSLFYGGRVGLMAACHGYVISWQENTSFYMTNIWSGNGFILYSFSVLFLFLGDKSNMFSCRPITSTVNTCLYF